MIALLLILLVFVGLSVGLAWYFISHDRGEKEPVGMLWIALLMGLLGAIAASVIEGFLIPLHNLDSRFATQPVIFGSAMLVGIIEEGCKFLPLSLIIYKRRYFNEHTDGLIYFSLAGMGFGLPENILYTLQFGSGAGIGRIILTPFFHAATTGIVGYFLIKGKLAHRTRVYAYLALGAAMVVHGLYDFGLMSGVVLFGILSVLITISVTVALFLFYGRATRADQRLGLSTVGHNSFCRSCGVANPNHNVYCSRCGKYA